MLFFAADEVYNQQRLNDINKASIKTVLTHTGLDVGEDGMTHQCIDYVGLFRNTFGWKVLVPADPNHADFRLGKTLGDQYTAFRRVKKGMPDRYRLFFRFASETASIIYIWLNNENTLRKEGSKTDVYVVFKKLLERGTVPIDISEMLKQSSEVTDETSTT